MSLFADRLANRIRAIVRRGGYELTKTHRMHALLDRQDALLRLAADALRPTGKGPVVEGIVFSKDRPLQLHLLLRSYLDQVDNPVKLHILYAASNAEFAKAYDEVAACFKKANFTFIKESKFKATLLQLLDSLKAPKLFFLTDDDVFVNRIDMDRHASIDPREGLLNVVMSPSLTHCYTTQRSMEVPEFNKVKGHPELLEFAWGSSTDMWDYPMMVDGTLFDTAEIRLMAKLTEYKAPNSFEGALMEFAHGYRQRKGYCYSKCIVINLPLNKVQTENANHAGSSGVEALLQTWQEGMEIDPTPFYGMDFTGFKTREPLDEMDIVVKRRG